MGNFCVNVQDWQWQIRDIVKSPMEMVELWDDGNCSAKIAKMTKGEGFGMHRHDTWIMVYVISGKLQIMPDETIVEAGGFYYVEPGTEHDDVCIEDNTMVLVIRDEPNKQYPVAATGS